MIPIMALPKGKSLAEFEAENDIQDTIYYLVTSGGLHVRKRNGMYDCLHKFEGDLDMFGEESEDITVSFAPVPRKLVAEITSLCREVYVRYKAEAIVLLYYKHENRQWAYLVPEQETQLNGLSVDYKTPQGMGDGWTLFGSMHSHCDCSAFQSGTDHEDEANFEGVHITVGHLDGEPDYDVRLHACGAKWTLEDQSSLVEPMVQLVPVNEKLLENIKPVKSTAFSSSAFTPATDLDKEKDLPFGADTRRMGTVIGPNRQGSVVTSADAFTKGFVFCRDAQSWVHPMDASDDVWEVGAETTCEGIDYVKKKWGWEPVDENDYWSLLEQEEMDFEDEISRAAADQNSGRS